VDVQRHTAGWNWRLDKPFPVTGPAGGAHISDGAEVVVRDFAPAAEHVIYVALVDEHGDMLMPPAVDATTFLAPPVDAVAAAAAAARVAYVSTDEELHILRADGSNRATVQPDTAIDDMGPARWSRSGRAVFAAWTDGDGHGGTPGRRLFVTDASTGVARLTGSAIGVSHPDWAPDGNRIVYAVGASIETANSDDGSNRREIASGGELSRPRYSPDGNQIAYLDSDWRHTTLHAADATGGDRHAVADLSPVNRSTSQANIG
jgi:Tol biopolymer transport system component